MKGGTGMIELKIEPYCYDCPCFVASQQLWGSYLAPATHEITCERSTECKAIAKYLESQMKEE